MPWERSPHRSERKPRDRPAGAERRRTLLAGGGSRPVLGFLLRFVLCWAVALGLATLFPAIERWAIRSTLWSLGVVVHPFATRAQVSGNLLQVGGASLSVVADCTPLMPTAALWAAVLAFPAPWRWRFTGLAAGAVVIWIYNLARILALVPVVVYRPEWFEFIHVYLWQTMTLIVVFAFFLAWLRLQPAPRSEA